MALLKGVAETLLIPLWARAAETNHPNAIFQDPKSLELVAAMDYDFSHLKKAWKSQVAVAIRTKLIDEYVENFIQKFPSGYILNLGAGLDTRFERLNTLQTSWFELDQPEVIALKRSFFQEHERYQFIASSVLDFSWIQQLPSISQPTLILAEGLFMYLKPDEVQSIFLHLIEHFSTGEIVFECIGRGAVGRSQFVDSVSKMQKPVPLFQWGFSKRQEVEQWHPTLKIKEEKYLFDHYRQRWRWLKHMSSFPRVKKWIGHRIVSVSF